MYVSDSDHALLKESVVQFGPIIEKIFGHAPGITTSAIYMGGWATYFPWHQEDLDLAAANFLIEGAPKVWYSIPSSSVKAFRNFARKHFGREFSECPTYARHKEILIDPRLLEEEGIVVQRMVNI